MNGSWLVALGIIGFVGEMQRIRIEGLHVAE